MSAKTIAKLALVKINCVRETAKERDKRYEQRFVDQEKAVVLARNAAQAARGQVNILSVVSIVSLLLAIASYFK